MSRQCTLRRCTCRPVGHLPSEFPKIEKTQVQFGSLQNSCPGSQKQFSKLPNSSYFLG